MEAENKSRPPEAAPKLSSSPIKAATEYSIQDVREALRWCLGEKDSFCTTCVFNDCGEHCRRHMNQVVVNMFDSLTLRCNKQGEAINAQGEAITEQSKAIQTLQDQMRWIPVTERMPEPYVDVLVDDIEEGIHEAQWIGYTKWWRLAIGISADKVTHWMPIPKREESSKV